MKKPTPPQPPEPEEEDEIREQAREGFKVLAQLEKREWRLGQQDRRVQRRQVIAELIARHKTIRSQTEIQNLLEKRGMFATQSSISRDLRDLGVQRVKGIYVIKPGREGGWSFDDIIGLLELVTRSGPYMTVIQTLPGSGRLVARSLEESGWDEVVGTVSDENTVFVAHQSKEGQDQLFERFNRSMEG